MYVSIHKIKHLNDMYETNYEVLRKISAAMGQVDPLVPLKDINFDDQISVDLLSQNKINSLFDKPVPFIITMNPDKNSALYEMMVVSEPVFMSGTYYIDGYMKYYVSVIEELINDDFDKLAEVDNRKHQNHVQLLLDCTADVAKDYLIRMCTAINEKNSLTYCTTSFIREYLEKQ